jgi:hypothetical protein
MVKPWAEERREMARKLAKVWFERISAIRVWDMRLRNGRKFPVCIVV